MRLFWKRKLKRELPPAPPGETLLFARDGNGGYVAQIIDPVGNILASCDLDRQNLRNIRTGITDVLRVPQRVPDTRMSGDD